MKLVQPDRRYLESYKEYYAEWKKSGEQIVPSVVEETSPEEGMFEHLHNRANGINIPAGRVPDSTYWLVNEQERVVGVCNIRHGLTQFLRNAGGHIGYGIAPSCRKKGAGREILGASLWKAAEIGLTEVLVVCDHWNAASRNIIQAYEPRRIEDHVEADGNLIERYWIKTRRNSDE